MTEREAEELSRHVLEAATEGVKKARDEYRRSGHAMASWRDGHVVWADPVTGLEVPSPDGKLPEAAKIAEFLGRTGADGMLHIDLPLGRCDQDYRLTIIVNRLKNRSPEEADQWPDGFIESTFGRWTGDFDIDSEGDC